MAVSRGTWQSGGSDQNYTPDSGSNRIVLYCIGYETNSAANRPVTGVTFDGTAMTQAVGVISSPTGQWSYVFYILETDIDGTNGDFVTTFGGTGSFDSQLFSATTIIDADQAAPTDTNTDFPGNNNVTTVAVTATDGGYSVWQMNHGRPGTVDWTGGPTEQSEGGAASSVSSAADKLETSAGSSSGTATASGDTARQILSCVAHFNAAAGGPSPVGGTMQTIWDDRFALVGTSQKIWHTRSIITDAVQYVWNVRITISDTCQKVWNIRSTTSDTIQYIWNDQFALPDTTQFIWDTLAGGTATVNLSLQYIWNSVGFQCIYPSATLSAGAWVPTDTTLWGDVRDSDDLTGDQLSDNPAGTITSTMDLEMDEHELPNTTAGGATLSFRWRFFG